MTRYHRNQYNAIRNLVRSRSIPLPVRLHVVALWIIGIVPITLRGYAYHAVHGGPFGLNDPIWSN